MKTKKKLYKYQQELVDRAEWNTALYWDMGLGKTITSIEVFEKFNLDRLFVICPVSMIDEWCEEFEKQTGRKAMPYKKAVKNAKGCILSNFLKSHEVDCIALNYEMVWRISDYSWITDKTMIICDESHRIKNRNSKIGKFMKHLKLKTKYKMCLTGTPQSQGYIDFYNQLYFLDMIDISWMEFNDRYCIYDMVNFQGVKIKQLVGYKNVDEFERLYLNKCEFLKVDRVYDEVIKYNYVNLKTSKEYEKVKKHRVVYYDSEGNIMLEGNSQSYDILDNIGSYRFGLRKLLDSKYKHEWLEEFLNNYNKRIVIFYNYNHELESICRICKKVGKKYSVYNGGEKNFDNFKTEEDGVAIVNYKSGSYGINDLVISNLFIAYSPTDNYLEWEQSKKRIDRNGQKNTPIYYFLQSGLENNIYNSLKSGKNFDDKLFINSLKLE